VSACRYCHRPITWLPRQNGSFYPPFEADEQIESAEYEVSSSSGEFVARLANTEIHVKLKPHRCREYVERNLLPSISVPDDDDEGGSAYRDGWDNGYEAGKRSVQHRETVVKVQPTHEQSIRLAKKLGHHCPTCKADAYAWCTYMRGEHEGEETKQLHSDR
jgi:hypothetical protein